MWLTALVAVWELMSSFSDVSQLKHQHRKSPLVQPSLCQSSARWQSSQSSTTFKCPGQPPISEELMTLMSAATVHKSVLDGFRAPGIATCGRCSSLADDLPDLREALSEMFNVDKKHGPLHRLEASRLVEVWQQAKARTETQQKVESAARAHGMPVELPCRFLGEPHESIPRPAWKLHSTKGVASSVVL